MGTSVTSFRDGNSPRHKTISDRSIQAWNCVCGLQVFLPQICGATYPKSDIHCCPLSEIRAGSAASTFHELRKVMGTSQIYDSSTAFLFEDPEL